MAFAAYSQHPSGFSKKHQLQQRSQWTTLWQIALREESVVFLGPSNQCVSAFEEINVVGLVLAVQELADVDVDTLESLSKVSTTTLRPRHFDLHFGILSCLEDRREGLSRHTISDGLGECLSESSCAISAKARGVCCMIQTMR